MRDKKLCLRLREGDSAALERAMDIYSPYAYSIICAVIDNALPREDAEEALYDSFLCLWENRQKLREGSLKAYIGAIARSRALDRLRKNRLLLPLEEDILLAEARGPEAQSLLREMSEAAREAVESLPEPEREIFKRRYFLYEKVQKIAEDMGLKPSTVSTKLSRGREKLRDYLTEKGYCDEN